MTDRATGRPRGFAFVEMATDTGAQSAMQALDETVDGRALRVAEAEERQSKPAGFSSNWTRREDDRRQGRRLTEDFRRQGQPTRGYQS